MTKYIICILVIAIKYIIFNHGDFSRNKEIITHQRLLTDEQIHKLTPTATDQLIFKRLKLGKNIKCKKPLPAKVKESIKKNIAHATFCLLCYHQPQTSNLAHL